MYYMSILGPPWIGGHFSMDARLFHRGDRAPVAVRCLSRGGRLVQACGIVW